MSGLVDIWSTELAKLKSKGQALFSSGSAPPSHEADASLLRLTGSAQAFQVKKFSLFQCSEASLSMLVDTFSA